ncbi:TPA: hypothetical protein ACKP8G_003943 [Serratia marcescens]
MGRDIPVEINDVIYSGATAPAKDQVEMLQIASRCDLLPAISDMPYNSTVEHRRYVFGDPLMFST